MNTNKFLPLVTVILPIFIFCFIVALAYCCGRAAVKQEQTMDVLNERIDYWRLKNAMAVIGIEDIRETGKNTSEIIWAKPLDRGNR